MSMRGKGPEAAGEWQRTFFPSPRVVAAMAAMSFERIAMPGKASPLKRLAQQQDLSPSTHFTQHTVASAAWLSSAHC
jgi:hypothetical protein